MHFMVLLHFGGNLAWFEQAPDVYTVGDSKILWSTFPVKTCFMAMDGDKPHCLPIH